MRIECDVTPVVKRLLKMQRRIRWAKRTGIGTVMSEWQSDDLNRNRPYTKRWRQMGQVRTLVRPHSLREMKRSRKFAKRELRRAKRRRAYVISRAYFKRSTRPILRVVMDTLLKERYREFIASIKW